MADNKITEGVGKKIVEALKMQSDVEITPIENEDFEIVEETEETFEPVEDFEEVQEEPVLENTLAEEHEFEEQLNEQPIFEKQAEPKPAVFETPVQQINPQFTETDDFEVPSNVAVLKQLITKLPAGVTKQTGALIIKQTMEALGISMKSVLQEAQQVQEGLNNSSRECQASIMEYKRQISILEKQAQKYQRQYAALNDIISLFVQTSI